MEIEIECHEVLRRPSFQFRQAVSHMVWDDVEEGGVPQELRYTRETVMADSDNKKVPRVETVGIVGVAMLLSPLLAIVLELWRMKWRRAWVSLSVLLNVFFISMFAIVALDERTESQSADEEHETLIGPDCVEYEPEFLKFCRPRNGSDLARTEPNTIYVAAGGLPRARFEYEGENLQAISDISAFDEFGRSWVNVNFRAGLISFDHYPNDARSSPDMTFVDRDLDGIPDQKIDWDLKKGFERVGEVGWRVLKKKDD